MRTNIPQRDTATLPQTTLEEVDDRARAGFDESFTNHGGQQAGCRRAAPGRGRQHHRPPMAQRAGATPTPGPPGRPAAPPPRRP
ncbi:hypothetical protein ACWEO1_34175, partial [Kitasatospora cineracea]